MRAVPQEGGSWRSALECLWHCRGGSSTRGTVGGQCQQVGSAGTTWLACLGRPPGSSMLGCVTLGRALTLPGTKGGWRLIHSFPLSFPLPFFLPLFLVFFKMKYFQHQSNKHPLSTSQICHFLFAFIIFASD